MNLKLSFISILPLISILAIARPSHAGTMRGDCSFFQVQNTLEVKGTDSFLEGAGIPEFDDCNVRFTTSNFEISAFRKGETLIIPVNKITSVEVGSYTVQDFKARTAFAFTYESDNSEGFDVLTFRMKTKRAVTLMAVLRRIMTVQINGGITQ